MISNYDALSIIEKKAIDHRDMNYLTKVVISSRRCMEAIRNVSFFWNAVGYRSTGRLQIQQLLRNVITKTYVLPQRQGPAVPALLLLVTDISIRLYEAW
jgi:hypothetical protein